METSIKNPKRVAAGLKNAALRRPWSDADRQRQRERCIANKPWKASTGPRTAAGKAKVGQNGSRQTPDPDSIRQIKARLAGSFGFLGMMQSLRQEVAQRKPNA